MGGVQSNKKSGFLGLRDSIPGSLVPEQDFELFYSKCKIETARTMSSALHPSPSQMFFVVISGEVNVQLSSPDTKNKVVTAATYTVGEMIHFFNSPTSCNSSSTFNDFGECLRYGDVKLSLHFNHNHKQSGRVIGIDRQAYDDFVQNANGNLHTLTSFLGLDVANIVKKTAFFKAITQEQAQMYGMLLKVQLSFAGKEINNLGRTPRAVRKQDISDSPDTTPSPIGCIAICLHGEGLSVPLSVNLASLANHIVSAEAKANGQVGKKNIKKISSGFAFRAPTKIPEVPGIPGIFDLPDISKPVPSNERENSLRSKNMVAMQEGACFGVETFYVRSSILSSIRAYITSTPTVLGYIAHDSLSALFEADTRFKRVYTRNFFHIVLNWVKFSVPFIMDMDEWSLALLSCKVTMRGCKAGEAVKRKGDSSEYAYIVLGGSCKELANPIEDGGSPEAGADRTIGWGGLIGEVALTTNTPYFHTVVAEAPTMLLTLGKRVLDQIYYNNKAKLCEIRIRMMGTDVDLLHAIDHPRGSELFKEYLTRLHAQENFAFYVEVDRYDAICMTISRLYSQVLKMRAQRLQAETLENTIMNNNNNTAAPIGGHVVSSKGSTKYTTINVTNAAGSLLASDKLIAEESASQANSTRQPPAEHNASAHSLLSYSDSEVHSNNSSGHNLRLSTEHSILDLNKASTNTHSQNPDGIASSEIDQQKNFQVKFKPQSSKNSALFASNKITIVEDGDRSDADEDNHKERFDQEFSVRRSMAIVVKSAELNTSADAANVNNAMPENVSESGESTDACAITPNSFTEAMKAAQKAAYSSIPGNENNHSHSQLDTNNSIVSAASSNAISTFSVKTNYVATTPGKTDLNNAGAFVGFPPVSTDTNIFGDAASVEVAASAQTTNETAITTGTDVPTETSTLHPTRQRYSRSSFLQSKADTMESALLLHQGKHDHEDPTSPTHSIFYGKSDQDDNGAITPFNDPNRRPSSESKQDLQLRIRRNVHKIQKSIEELKEVAKLIMETYVLEGSSQQLNLPGLMRLRAEKTFNLWYHSSSAKVKLPARQDSFQFMDTAQSDSIDKSDPSGQKGEPVCSSAADGSLQPAENKVTPIRFPVDTMTNSIRMLRRDFASDSNEDSVLQHSVLLPAPINTALPFLPSAALKYASTSEAESPSVYLTLSGDSGNYAHLSVEGIDMSFIDLFKEAKQEILKLLRDDKFPRWKATTEFQDFIANVRPYERDKNKPNSNSGDHINNSDKSRSIDSASLRSKQH